jgi:hypothetical protein
VAHAAPFIQSRKNTEDRLFLRREKKRDFILVLFFAFTAKTRSRERRDTFFKTPSSTAAKKEPKNNKKKR